MGFSSGTFTYTTSGLPVVTGTTISATVENNKNTETAAGLSTCLLKDGTQTVTANLPMAGFKLTGLGAGSANGDSVRWQQAPGGIMTAKGDLIGATAANTPAALAVGSNGTFLLASSGASTGLAWGTVNDFSAETTLDQTNDRIGVYDATDSLMNSMTPAKFVEGMAGTQAELEAGTSTSVLVVPGRQQYHNSAAKCWVYAGVNGTAFASYNVTSVTDTGTGVMSIAIANDFNTDLWVALPCGFDTGTRTYTVIAQGTGTCTISCNAASPSDPSTGYFFAGFGDQP